VTQGWGPFSGGPHPLFPNKSKGNMFKRFIAEAEIVTQTEAERRGMYPLTNPYEGRETWMLARALAQLGKISRVLVNVPGQGLEIWRARRA